MKKAIITGCLGQDGSYMAEQLLALGYEVHGIVRGVSSAAHHYVQGVTYHIGDMRDKLSLENIFRKVWPDEVYNFAGQVFVPTSWTNPEATFDVNVCGLTRILSIVDSLKRDTKVYQASSSEMYGNVGGSLNESSPMKPVSPYGISKLAAHKLAEVYRAKGLYVVGGILYNHESPRRAEHMVTRKITKQVARWALGDEGTLELGNTHASRDWGHARDYMRGIYLMMKQETPDDYVLGTGMSHSVNEFLHTAVKSAGLKWDDVKHLIVTNANPFMRQGELFYLQADASKAHILLGWKPQTTFAELVEEMVQSDIKAEQNRMQLEEAGGHL